MTDSADTEQAGADMLGPPPGAIAPPPPPAPVGDRFADVVDSVGKRVTLLGGIVAAVVAINSSLSSCSNDNLERYRTFRSAVGAEEKFWNDLYNDYLSTFESPPDGADGDAVKEKLLEKRRAIQALTNHEVPDFSEHKLGLLWNVDSPQRQANANITAIKSALVDALSKSQDPEIAETTQAAIFAADEAKKVRTTEATNNLPPTPVQTTVQTGSVISYQSQTVSAGSPKGWDIDVFWCAAAMPDAPETLRYNEAVTIAQRLGDAANGSGSKLSDDLLLGRVRLRSLPHALQGKGYPTSGREIRYNNDRDEREAAAKIRAWLSNTLKIDTSPRITAMKTPNYISLFICS